MSRGGHPRRSHTPTRRRQQDTHTCLTVFSTFWVWDDAVGNFQLVEPPAGFPTLVMFNSWGQAEEPLVEVEPPVERRA